MQNEMYLKYARDYADAIEDNIYNAKLDRPSLQALCPELAEKNVLDLACGPGAYSRFLIEQGAKVTAIDISPAMIEIVKGKFDDGVHALCHDMAAGLPMFEDNSVDLVICPLAVHYIEDLQPLFNDVARILKPSGSFIFSTHHPMADFAVSPTGNYFLTELITQDWNTLDHKVEVSFYRRPLSALIETINEAICV